MIQYLFAKKLVPMLIDPYYAVTSLPVQFPMPPMSCDYPLSIMNILFIEPDHLHNNELHINLMSIPQKSPMEKHIQIR